MAIFSARLTRRRSPLHAAPEEFVPSADPEDPWAAYRPRPFDDVERRRPRMWPVVAGVFGLVLVAGGVVGARQSTQFATVDAAPTTKPYLVDVRPPSTPKPTPAPTPAPTLAAAPQVYHPTPATKPVKASIAAAAPNVAGSLSCAAGSLRVSVSITGTHLSWFGLYLDGKVVKGGPISGSSFSTSYSKPATKGDHTAEATADDAAGHHGRRLFTIHCA
jgi:hypothetical protein